MSSEVLPPLNEHQLLLLFSELFLLLITARGLGELAKRFNLPSVLGELLAGIVIGPSILGAVMPGVFLTVFPPEASQYHLLEAVSWIGLTMLLIVTGLETDLDLIMRRAKPAAYTALTGIVFPFVMGFGLAYLLPGEFLAANDQRFVFSLFLGTALSISAIPVIAKVLIDMDVMGRDIGQITIASGMLNDTIGWILLALVASLARTGSGQALGTAGETILWLAIFLGVSFTLGRRLTEWIMRWVDTNFGGDDLAKITVVMILALGVGAITQFLGLEAVLGAFVVGVLVGQVRRFDQVARHTFEVVTIGIFAPVFFATAGLRVDLTAMANPTALLGGTAILAVAIVGKFVGSFVGARAAGLSSWEGIAMGSGLNARGALEIIVATIGLSVGVLTTTTYTIIVMVAIITSLIAPPLLRASLARIEPSDEEIERLEREALQRRSFLGNIVRVLFPTRCSIESQFAARLLGHIVRGREIAVTSMYVDTAGTATSRPSLLRRTKRTIAKARNEDKTVWEDGGPLTADTIDQAESCLDLIDSQLALPQKDIRKIVRSAEPNISETVLTEANEGYDLLALGTNKQPTSAGGPLFSLAIDDLIQRTPCPLMVVASSFDSHTWTSPDGPIKRILLPTVGTQYSRRAAEIAFAIAADCGAVVDIVHVVDRPQVDEAFIEQSDISGAIALGDDIVTKEAELGGKMEIDTLTDVSASEKPERSIVERTMIHDADLVVIGSESRSATRRAFFGHRVEYIVRNANCPVAVISSASQGLEM